MKPGWCIKEIAGQVKERFVAIAVYLTFWRSPFFALAYAANDIVLIGLWIMASIEDISCLSVVICSVLFLINDYYGYISWRKMEQRQRA